MKLHHNTLETWSRLLHFPRRCFRVPRHSGRRWNLSTLINNQIQEENDPPPPTSWENNSSNNNNHRHTSQTDSLRAISARISSKLEEGDYKGAVRLACSEDSFAENTSSTIKALQSKHPPPHPDTAFPPEISTDANPPLIICQQDVTKALLSFLRGSASGPDCL